MSIGIPRCDLCGEKHWKTAECRAPMARTATPGLKYPALRYVNAGPFSVAFRGGNGDDQPEVFVRRPGELPEDWPSSGEAFDAIHARLREWRAIQEEAAEDLNRAKRRVLDARFMVADLNKLLEVVGEEL